MKPEDEREEMGRLLFKPTFIFGEVDADRYTLDYCIDALKKSQATCEVLASIGWGSTWLSWMPRSEVTSRILEDLTIQVRPTLEGLVGSLGAHSQLGEPERRQLFYARFALAFLSLAAGDRGRFWDLLHEFAATEVSRRGLLGFRSGTNILKCTHDVVNAKGWAASFFFYQRELYKRQELPDAFCWRDYKEYAYATLEALACGALPLAVSLREATLADILDLWAEYIETHPCTDPEVGDLSYLDWIGLFGVAAAYFEICEADTPSGDLPSTYSKDSAQFVAWKFGEWAARFAISRSRRGEEPLQRVQEWAEPILDLGGSLADWKWVGRGLVVSLLSEAEPSRNWNQQLQRYIAWWQDAGIGTDPNDPCLDLYWAIRIGFASYMLAASSQTLVPSQTALHPVQAKIDSIYEIMSTVALRQLKDAQGVEQFRKLLEDRLPPTRSEVERQIRKHFPDEIWKNSSEGIVRKTPDKVSLREWSTILEGLGAPPGKELADLGRGSLRQFVDSRGIASPALRFLARLLNEAADYRGGSAHSQDASRSERERKNLDEMRRLVLGIGRDSVIAKIYELLPSTGSIP